MALAKEISCWEVLAEKKKRTKLENAGLYLYDVMRKIDNVQH